MTVTDPSSQASLVQDNRKRDRLVTQLTQSCIATVHQAAAVAAGCHWVYQASERIRECLLRQ